MLETYLKESPDYSATMQGLIDTASNQGDPVVYLAPGEFLLDHNVILSEGVSLQGSLGQPTILTAKNGTDPITIKVPANNRGWSIKDIVFDNVNIEIQPHNNDEESSILGNLFLNGGRGSVMALYGEQIYIDGNIFLRDQAHAGTKMIPSYNTTNTGILFQTQKNSVISNNIFGMDLRNMHSLVAHVAPQLQRTLNVLDFVRSCLGKPLDDQQGFLASAIQMYSTNDITIKENILNATFPDKMPIAQDHGISIVGCNATYIYQNFVAGWELADFGGAFRFTSAVDGYVISNYLANTAVMMYAATHADFMQVSNMVVADNFLYRFLDHNVDPPAPLDGWLYEGITFFDFYTARLNYTIRPPIWNSSVPISPWGWHIVVTDNKFGAAEGIDPNVISLGNLDPKEALVDKSNCYVTEPIIPGSPKHGVVPLLWRQMYEPNVYTKNGGKIPKWYRPPTDITETATTYEIRAEMPGVDKKDIELEMTDSKTLFLQSRYHDDINTTARYGAYPKKAEWWTNERVLGAFSRTIQFPTEVSGEAIKAVYKDGVLNVTVPKTKGAQGTRITIE
ncbi:hypothetical protein EC973_005029 [Apophysomyces ossiformis]|uniref:SHSP domain-containing protein n=1 Tax=Apophysomyces ossiformis TaxID=679940 RepID=A0A8H7BSE5_9FUNG|nr:hypothetical protein EC973_005029 [Apophysomyces ossiformis]